MNLGTLFEFAVERFPDNEALIQGEVRLSYAQLNQRADHLAAGLLEKGVGHGDRVVVVLKNRLETVILYWAVQKIGAIFTPINFRLSEKEVEHCILDSDPKAVVYEPASEGAVLGATKNSYVFKVSVEQANGADISFEDLQKLSDAPKRPVIQNSDTCLMLYTSGTTGSPKGVPRTHQNEYGAALAHIIQNHYETKEITLGVMPLYHTMGMRSLLSMAFLNGKLILVPDYDPKTLLQIIDTEKVTCVYLVPTIVHAILNHPNFQEFDLSSLKKLGYAGAAMTKALIQDCFDKLKPDVFVNHYGSTEVYTYSICNYLDKKPGCAGKAGFHQRIRVVKADPSDLSTPDDIVNIGESGEIIIDIRSIESFQGYWKRPDATAKAIRNGWYFTGDLGVLDEDGDLFVQGRVDDMINSGGENIHPLEVEDVLVKHPSVSEASVVGLPDDLWGEVVAAFIVPKDDTLTEEQLDEYCRNSKNLSNFKRPRKYFFVDSIPKSPVGKILRRRLREDYTEKIISK